MDITSFLQSPPAAVIRDHVPDTCGAVSGKAASVSDAEKQKQLENAKKYYENGKFRSGSLASKANMVSQFNDAKKNDKK